MKYKQTIQTGLLLFSTLTSIAAYSADPNCNLTSVNLNSFGQVTTTSDVTGFHLADITVNCNRAYLLGIDAGSHFSAGSRQLAESSHLIPYTLFQENTAVEWGSQGLSIANVYPNRPTLFSGSGTANLHSLYASVATKDKNQPLGVYRDNVTLVLVDKATQTILETTSLNFDLTFDTYCTLDTTGFTSFGNYMLGSPAILNQPLGSITATCPLNVAYKIGIDKGQHLAGRRHLSLNNAFIPYQLKYNNVEWGDSGLTAIEASYIETFPALAISEIATGATQTFNITGDAWIENTTTAGTYTDTVIVTLVW